METLVEELKSARILNRTLTEKLSQSEHQLDQTINFKEDTFVELEAKVSARGAALVDKLYAAQKAREQAMIQRMNILKDEKEELIDRINELEKQNGFFSGLNMDHDMANQKNPDEFVGKFSSFDPLEDIMQNENIITRRLVADKQKVLDQYQKIKKERDDANEKVELLQEELRQVIEQRATYDMQHRSNEKNRFKALQTQLKSVIKERDEAVTRGQSLEDEIQKMHLQLNLKNSLSKEDELRKQFNSTLDEFEVELQEKENQLSIFKQSYDETVTKLNVALSNNEAVLSELAESRNNFQEQKTRADSLKLGKLLKLLKRF